MKYTPAQQKDGGLPQFSSALNGVLKEMGVPFADSVIIRPINPLVSSQLDPTRKKVMTNERVRAYNLHLRQTVGHYYHNVQLPHYIYKVNEAAALHKLTVDGFHYEDAVVRSEVEMMLNSYCNPRMVTGPLATVKTTCCVKDGGPSWKQLAVLGLGAVFGPVTWALRIWRRRAGYGDVSLPGLPTEQTASHITKLLLTLTYIFLTDRTFIFPRVAKTFTTPHFTLLTLLYIIPGLLTLKRVKDTTFLNRHQTDEWKGWMQLAILVYHYTGASKSSVGVYNAVRVLVASYLFMTGYGHFTFFYAKGEFGVVRVLKVVARLNLLSVCMAYVMGRDALFFYFGPLVTFWFLVVYGTLRVGSRWNGNAGWVVAKMGVVGAVCWWVGNGGVLGVVFDVVEKVVKTRWDAKETAFRIALDQWVVFAGMVVAWVVIKVNNGDIRVLTVHGASAGLWRGTKTIALGLAAVVMVAFIFFETSFTDKFAYNRYHPYVSVPAVIAFIILRNATPVLRQTTSRFWCWIGAISLETFLLQYHMWLGVDTKGLLMIFSGEGELVYWVNLAVTTVVFFGFSEIVGESTGRLVEWLVGKDKQRGLWRVGLLLVVFIIWNWM
ncbi:hypothetical protein HDV00_009851 [Rhizophlyctis rosea]|nr:hypothetical protein HDV00_009851 [Rhizophlyctis rosea]